MFATALEVDAILTTVKVLLKKVEKYFITIDMEGLFIDKVSYVNKSNLKKYKFKSGSGEFSQQLFGVGLHLMLWTCVVTYNCRAPLLEECPQHHGHKGDPGVTPGTCGAIGERAQVILVWVRAPGRWERLPPTETRSHEG